MFITTQPLHLLLLWIHSFPSCFFVFLFKGGIDPDNMLHKELQLYDIMFINANRTLYPTGPIIFSCSLSITLSTDTLQNPHRLFLNLTLMY